MRMPWFRLRTLLALNLLAAVVIGAAFCLHRRAERFQQRAIFHAQKEEEWRDDINMGFSAIATPDGYVASTVKRATYHAEMKKKYQYATLHPWVFVPPDPPPP